MTRLAVGIVVGLAVGIVVAAAIGLHAAQEIPDDVQAAADEAGVQPVAVLGALNILHEAGIDATPRAYLQSTGELIPPLPPPVSPRVACIESKESGGANVANRQGSGAVGVLQYFPTTFARGAREMGHPEWSPWVPWQARIVAAHDLALGRRSQWAVGGCN